MKAPIFPIALFRGRFVRLCQAYFILSVFLINTLGSLPAYAQSDGYYLPAPGVMVRLSPPIEPAMLKGIKVNPDDPFQFEFILDKGDIELNNDQIKDESSKLIKYFLASLTIPENDLWVNLSPYEKERIIPNSFGFTEMGRDLLAEDYMLKQITASLIYPEDEVGKRFWKRIYEEAAKRYGTTNIPVNTFNKVWIVPDKAVVFENAKAGTAYIVESKLKVMLEEDYLAFEKNSIIAGEAKRSLSTVNSLGSQIVREIVIPALTTEINENKNFTKLRQVYDSLILATWYKKKIKDSILSQVYADKNKTAGVQYTSTVIPAKAGIHSKNDVEGVYQQYLKAFKKGVYSYIKEEQDPITQEMIPRKYFSGGEALFDIGKRLVVDDNQADVAGLQSEGELVVKARINDAGKGQLKFNAAMQSLEQIKKAPVYSTIEDRQRLVGTGHVLKSPDEWENLGWMTLTDHITTNFLPRAEVLDKHKDFLRPEEVVQAGDDSVYHYDLPEDLTIEETLKLIESIKKIEKFSLKEQGKILPALSQRLKQIAIFMAKNDKTGMSKEKEQAIKNSHALSIILGQGANDLVVPEIEEDELMAWLGLERPQMNNEEALMKRALELSIRGVQIELESLTYWRGMELLKKDKDNGTNIRQNKFSFNSLLEILGLKKASENSLFVGFDFKKERKIIQRSKNKTEAQLEAIRTVLGPILKLPGWVKTKGKVANTLESSPMMIRLTNEINCIGRSALMALYLQQLGIDSNNIWRVTPKRLANGASGIINDEYHVLLLARLSDGRYFWIEPSGDPSNAIRPASLSMPENTTLSPQGTTLYLGNDPDYQQVFIDPWRQGIASTFYNNMGVGLEVKRDYQGAITAYQKAIMLSPNNTITYNYLADLLVRSGRFQEALEVLDQAIRTNPLEMDAYNNKAHVLNLLSRPQEALEVLNQALGLEHQAAVVYKTLAEVKERLDDIEGSQKAYLEAERLEAIETQLQQREVIVIIDSTELEALKKFLSRGAGSAVSQAMINAQILAHGDGWAVPRIQLPNNNIESGLEENVRQMIEMMALQFGDPNNIDTDKVLDQDYHGNAELRLAPLGSGEKNYIVLGAKGIKEPFDIQVRLIAHEVQHTANRVTGDWLERIQFLGQVPEFEALQKRFGDQYDKILSMNSSEPLLRADKGFYLNPDEILARLRAYQVYLQQTENGGEQATRYHEFIGILNLKDLKWLDKGYVTKMTEGLTFKKTRPIVVIGRKTKPENKAMKSEGELRKDAGDTIILFRKISDAGIAKEVDPENPGLWWATSPFYFGGVDQTGVYELHISREALRTMLANGAAVDTSTKSDYNFYLFRKMPEGSKLISKSTKDFINGLMAASSKKESPVTGTGLGRLSANLLPAVAVMDQLGGRDVFHPDSSLYKEWVYKVLKASENNSAMDVGEPKRSRGPGGIDFTSKNMGLQTQNAGEGIKFHLDAAMLTQLQNSPGFEPVIISVEPLKSLSGFLGLNQETVDNS